MTIGGIGLGLLPWFRVSNGSGVGAVSGGGAACNVPTISWPEAFGFGAIVSPADPVFK